MARFTLVLPALLLFALALPAQQQPSTPTTQKTPTYAAIPVEAINQPNPVKSSPESLSRAKKWWTLDCAMCHGADGNGKGETAVEMKLKLADFTDPATSKIAPTAKLFIIKNGHNDMPPEGQRIKTEENWDLVNYVRSLAKKQPAADPKP